MFVPIAILRKHLTQIITEKAEQGHVTDGLAEALAALPDSYDAVYAFAKRVADLPLRADWPYVEPSEYDEIVAELDPTRPLGKLGTVSDREARVETAFMASVCGCVLGKPLEINPTLADVRKALEAVGEWPMKAYVSEKVAPHLPRAMHHSWKETTREHITYVASDDDINYTVLGMLNLEQHGIGFTKKQLKDLWLHQLPISTTFGPERTTLLKAGLDTYHGTADEATMREWVTMFTPREEFCGALIRADAYGYACAGEPALAAELAWRDASFTHRRTGIYGTMFIAAAIAAAFTQPKDPLDIFRTALKFVPQRSRLCHILNGCLEDIESSGDWLTAYEKIHAKHFKWDHCRVFQELGTVMNTLRFAEGITDGICKQVSQGNDTDSYGATCGSILGAYFGPAKRRELDAWIKPFNDDLRTTLAQFYERSLVAVAKRMMQLPALVDKQRAEGVKQVAEQKARDAAAGL